MRERLCFIAASLCGSYIYTQQRARLRSWFKFENYLSLKNQMLGSAATTFSLTRWCLCLSPSLTNCTRVPDFFGALWGLSICQLLYSFFSPSTHNNNIPVQRTTTLISKCGELVWIHLNRYEKCYKFENEPSYVCHMCIISFPIIQLSYCLAFWRHLSPCSTESHSHPKPTWIHTNMSRALTLNNTSLIKRDLDLNSIKQIAC